MSADSAQAGASAAIADGVALAIRACPVAMAFARDPECRQVVCNAAMDRLLPASLDWHAWSLPDGTAPHMFDPAGLVIAPEDHPLRRAARLGERTVDRRVELRWNDRRTVLLRVGAEPLFDAAGARVGAMFSAVDVRTGDGAPAASAGDASFGEPGRLDAEADSRAKDELIALVGHELRNPMNAISTAVEVLERAAPAAPEALSARRIIVRQVRRLAQLINELGEVGRDFADRSARVHAPLDLGALVQQCVVRASSVAQARAQHLRTELTEVWIDADARRVAQGIDRLLDDAMRWAADGGTILVRLESHASVALLEIRELGETEPGPLLDPGPAETASASARHPMDRHRSGLGLSFAWVRRIVEQHGGRIDARRHDAATGGSRVVLRLPALAGVYGAERAPSPQALAERPGQGASTAGAAS